jgi:hypothetical protein
MSDEPIDADAEEDFRLPADWEMWIYAQKLASDKGSKIVGVKDLGKGHYLYELANGEAFQLVDVERADAKTVERARQQKLREN